MQKNNNFFANNILVHNCTMYSDHIHARSINSGHHPSRTWVKKLHAQIAHDIPENIRICGENMFATHSIHYENLPSYFLVFSIWEENTCFSWNDTLAFCDMLNLKTVPVLYRGFWNEDVVRGIYKEDGLYGLMEGYVVRLAESFKMEDFGTSLAKWVRKNHVQTDEHWMKKPVIPNGVKF